MTTDRPLASRPSGSSSRTRTTSDDLPGSTTETHDRTEHGLRAGSADRDQTTSPTSDHRPGITAFFACMWHVDLTRPCPALYARLRQEVDNPRPTTQNSIHNLVPNPSRSPRSRLSRVRGLREAPRGLQLRFARPHSAPSRPTPAPGGGRVRPPLPALWVASVGTCAGLSRALLFPPCGPAEQRGTSGRGKARASPDLCGHLPPSPPLGGAWHEIPASIAPPAPPHGGESAPSST